jgi:hypothetical protein
MAKAAGVIGCEKNNQAWQRWIRVAWVISSKDFVMSIIDLSPGDKVKHREFGEGVFLSVAEGASGRDTLYVAYGSNMDRTQMKSRCPQARFIQLITIPKYDVPNIFTWTLKFF